MTRSYRPDATSLHDILDRFEVYEPPDRNELWVVAITWRALGLPWDELVAYLLQRVSSPIELGPILLKAGFRACDVLVLVARAHAMQSGLKTTTTNLPMAWVRRNENR